MSAVPSGSHTDSPSVKPSRYKKTGTQIKIFVENSNKVPTTSPNLICSVSVWFPSEGSRISLGAIADAARGKFGPAPDLKSNIAAAFWSVTETCVLPRDACMDQEGHVYLKGQERPLEKQVLINKNLSGLCLLFSEEAQTPGRRSKETGKYLELF